MKKYYDTQDTRKNSLQNPSQYFLILMMVLMFFSGIFNTSSQIIQRGVATTATSTTTNVTINKPTGLTEGDIMLANIVQSDNDNAVLNNATLTGWTLVAGEEFGNIGNDSWWGTILYKVATVTDVAAVNFTFVGDADADDIEGGIIAFSGVAVTGGVAGGPFDVLPGTINNIITDDFSATAITTVTDNAAVIMFGMIGDNRSISNWTTTSPGALTELFDFPFDATADMGVGVAWGIKTNAGSTGTGLGELSGNENDPNGAILIALRPCTATPTITTTGIATSVCFSTSAQTTTLPYTATTNSPTSYSINWDSTANAAGLADQTTTSQTFASGVGSMSNIAIPTSLSIGTYNGTLTIITSGGCRNTQAISLTINPNVGIPTAITIAAGTEPTCQLSNGTTTTTYATTATNNTGLNWSLSNPAAGSITSSGVMTWSNGFSGTVNIQVTANGCNGPSIQIVRTVNVLPNSTVGTASSTPTLCINTALPVAITHTTTGATGIGTPTNLPAGVTATWASDTIIISGTPTTSGTFNYSIPLTGGCGSVSATGTITVTAENTNGVASSAPTLCINTALPAAIMHTTTGATGIGTPTNLPAGVTATWASNNITIDGTPTVAGIFNYSIPLTGGCGSLNATGNIIVEDFVASAGTIIGTPTACQGQTGVSFSVPAITNATGYIWTLPFGATIASGNNTHSITVDFSNNALSGDITVLGTNSCGNGIVSTNYTVTVDLLPDAAGTITGTTNICQGQTRVSFFVPAITNATGYIWTLPSGATIVSGSNTNAITVDFSTTASSGDVTVSGTNACGSGIVSANYPVTVNPLPAAAGNVLGSSTVCQGQTNVVYSVPAIVNATGYIWTLPFGATLVSGANTNAITVDFSSSASSGDVAVFGTNACGNGTVSATTAVTVNPLPIAAGTITGPPTVCQGQSSVVYTVPAITHATGYTWVLPSGASITAGSNTNSITVTFSTTAVSGDINVMGTNACGNGVVSANYPVTISPLPANADSISGQPIVCQGDIGVVYSVPVIANALNYIWTLPPGATITSGANTDTITVNYSLAASSGIITVRGNNACGDGVVSANYSVTVNITPAIILNYSPTVCSEELITVLPANGGGNIVPPGTTYSWGLPTVTGGITGATALSGQIDFNQTLINSTNTIQTASYNVTATTGGCSTTTFSVLVTVFPKPTVAAAPATQVICSNEAIGTAITFSNPNSISGSIDYNWTRDNTGNVTGMPPFGSGPSVTGNLSNASNTPQTSVFSVIATTQNGCNSLPFAVTVTVNPIPTVLATPSNQTTCSESPITAIILTNPNAVTGTTYSWTRTNNNANLVGIPDGSGSTISGILTNTTNTAITTVFTITAWANGCPSATTTLSITVNPKPTVAVSIPTQTVCGTAMTPITISNPNNVAGTTYSWTRDNTTNISGLTSGNGSTISGILVNNTNSNQTTIFTVTATAGTCLSTTTTTVIVRPTPTILITPLSQTICNGIAITPMNITNPNNVIGTTYTWTRNNLTNLTGLAASGTGSSITGTLTNSSTVTQTSTFSIIATAANGCSSTSTATVAVYAPLVSPIIGVSQTACILATPDPLTMTTPVSGGSGSYTYQWQRSTAATGQPWTAVGTLTTYNPPQLPLIGAQNFFYRLIVSDLCGTVTSNIISIEPVVNGSFVSSVSNYPTTAICPGTSFSPNIAATLHLASSAVRFTWSGNPTYITPSSGGPLGITSAPIFFFFRTSTATLGPLNTQNNTNTTITTPITITPIVYEFPGPPTGDQLCSVSSQIINIQIRPNPTATVTVPSATICSGTSAGIVVRGNITDATTTLSWTRSANANVISTVGSGSNTPVAFAGTYTIPDVLTNTSLTSQTVTYTITPSSNGCSGTPITVTITVAPAVNPGTIATNQTICSGESPVAFTQTVATGAGTPTYQWQSSTTGIPGSYSPISGATSPTYTPTGVTVNTWYIRTATFVSSGATPPVVTGVTYTTNSASCSQNTTPISITINTINPGSVAGTQTICSGGDPIAFTNLAATGAGTITYQWESSTTDCSNGFSDITVNGTSPTYDIPSGLTVTTYFRRKAISTLNTIPCTDYSNCITVSVNNVTAGTVGSDQTICGNNPSTFAVITPATGLGALSYQWESNTTGCGGTWNAISGAVGATYDPPPGLSVTTYYRRITTSTLNGIPCTAVGNCIIVTANSVTAGIISGNRTICSGGDPAVFTETIPATGIGLTYQWQFSLTSGAGPWTDISGATNATYDAPGPITQNTFYQRVVKATVNGFDCFAISNFITVFVNNVTPSTIAGNQSLCSNLDPAAFTVTSAATGTGTLSYQWQSNTTGCGGSWADISGATSATYNPPTITQTTYFQVRVTSTLNGRSCSSTSNCIEVTSFGKIWNGAINSDWSNAANWTPAGVPDATHCVTIPNTTNDPEINIGNAYAYSLSVLNGGDLEVEDDDNNCITVTDAISINPGGLFTIENNASLVQINNIVNTGAITYKRIAQQKRLDYVYWSSPVQNFNINSHPSNGPKYSWNTTFSNANGTQGNWQIASGIMNAGQGYIVGGPSWFNNTANQNLQVSFSGIPRNGDISITINRGNNNSGATYTLPSGAEVTTLDDNWNLLGNPYPSAISTRDFLTLNSSVLTGALYIWTHGNLPSTFIGNPFYDNFVSNYNPIDYIPFNLTGNLLSPNPDYYIGACQGFFVTMIDGPATSATVNFNNSLRNSTYGNSTGANFFRTQNTTTLENPEFNRIWLELSNNNMAVRTLVGYVITSYR